MTSPLNAIYLGKVDYAACLQAMQLFTAERNAQTPDEIWLCEHPPVFTLGLAAKREHLLAPGAIPVVATEIAAAGLVELLQRPRRDVHHDPGTGKTGNRAQ